MGSYLPAKTQLSPVKPSAPFILNTISQRITHSTFSSIFDAFTVGTKARLCKRGKRGGNSKFTPIYRKLELKSVYCKLTIFSRSVTIFSAKGFQLYPA